MVRHNLHQQKFLIGRKRPQTPPVTEIYISRNSLLVENYVTEMRILYLHQQKFLIGRKLINLGFGLLIIYISRNSLLVENFNNRNCIRFLSTLVEIPYWQKTRRNYQTLYRSTLVEIPYWQKTPLIIWTRNRIYISRNSLLVENLNFIIGHFLSTLVEIPYWQKTHLSLVFF